MWRPLAAAARSRSSQAGDRLLHAIEGGRPASSSSMLRSARVTVNGWPTGPHPWLTTTSTGTSGPSSTSDGAVVVEIVVEDEAVGAGREAGGGDTAGRR